MVDSCVPIWEGEEENVIETGHIRHARTRKIATETAASCVNRHKSVYKGWGSLFFVAFNLPDICICTLKWVHWNPSFKTILEIKQKWS